MTAHERFLQLATRPGDDDLAEAALHLATLEYPSLNVSRGMHELDRLSDEASRHVLAAATGMDVLAHVQAFGQYLFDEAGFTGNLADYENPRNSFLNDVLVRRTGIPITLAIVYMHVGRRAGLWLEGINFPGHYLVRCKGLLGDAAPTEDLVLDPFHGGVILTDRDCRRLLEKHAGHDVRFARSLLMPAFKLETLVRMLLNLKRAFARRRSFRQAREATSLLLALDPSAITELRDRGLLSYQLGHYNAALSDLERYLSLTARHRRPGEDTADDEEGQEFEALWEHVKNLRRRMAALN
jgi:regulator of sirC expression with transglutaminase-like and TPR domain